MTRDEIIRMARDAGMSGLESSGILENFERFAALVAAAERELLIDSVRQMRDVQGVDGNWNYDPYMQGLYNGLEFAVSLLEKREPQFKDAPRKWLGDQSKPRIFSARG